MGLTLASTRDHIVQATLRGIAHAVIDVVNLMDPSGKREV